MNTRRARRAQTMAWFRWARAPGVLCLACLVCLACVMVTGCSSSSSRQASGTAGDGVNVDVTFHMTVTAKAGTEVYVCQVVALPSNLGERAFMLKGSHDSTQGSHHFAVYATDFDSLPAGAGQITDCLPDNQSNNSLNHARGVIYAAQTPVGSWSFPPGVGLRVAAGQVVLLNYHYINATANDVDASANATLTITPNGAGITASAGVLFWNDPYVAVPAGAQAHAQMRCPIRGDITVSAVVSHYHKRGVSFAAYIDPAPNQLATTPFYTSDNWEDPGVLDQIIPIAAGSAIRYRCDYDNRAGSTDFFEGPSALTNEMCMLAATYYPDQGEEVNSCFLGADMYGTGSANCLQTAACLAKCPPAPPSTDVGVAYSPCTQLCMVNSCPAITTGLPPLVSCVQQNCADACGSSSDGGTSAPDEGEPGDGGTDPCTACAAMHCPMETSACEQSTCP
jgi:copper type II ascorbate-dependent monooxygenase-like protein